MPTKKILIYTDSRGQHTPAGGHVHDVFARRLAQRDDIEAEIMLCPMTWTTTLDFLDYLKERKLDNYDHIVLYTGIVDWSPRPQQSAFDDLYNNQNLSNSKNEKLNTRDYSKKVINNKKHSFDSLFGEDKINTYLNNAFDTEFEGSPTINMYSLEMARKHLIPKLKELDNLIYINSNRFVYGWQGDHKRGRPENITITEEYSELFRNELGSDKVIDLLQWSREEIQIYTCDNLHLTKEGSDWIYERLRRKILENNLKPTRRINFRDDASTFSFYDKVISTPAAISTRDRQLLRKFLKIKDADPIATLIIGVKFDNGDKFRYTNLRFLLSWIDHYYGNLFDVLVVEQGVEKSGRAILADARPYVRHEFLYNSGSYNRGWGFNVAVKHYTQSKVIALLDSDVLTGGNFIEEVISCHLYYKVVSPYSNIYFTNQEEVGEIIASNNLLKLNRKGAVIKPVTITGGMVIIRRDVYEEVCGFEQYTEYGGEDRTLDVTLLNYCEESEIRIAPFVYVHMYHPDGGASKRLGELMADLYNNYGCRVSDKLEPQGYIHQNCHHVSIGQTLFNSQQRKRVYGDPNLYKSGHNLMINGLYQDNIAPLIFPSEYDNMNSYEAREIYKAPAPDSVKLAAFYNVFKGQRCFIIGNGPSLNKHDLSLLEGEFTFAVNGFFYKTKETGFRPTFFVVEDNAVMQENIEEIRAYEVPFKLFPTPYKELHQEGDNVYFFSMNRGFYEQSSPNYCIPRFSTDASKILYCGQSVTYINLQLAFFMGFTEVYLIGMDFDYIVPKEHIVTGNAILSTTDDPNHFHKDYFGKGKTWKLPKIDRVAVNYKMAKLAYESVGRKIYNATEGGKLEIFGRKSYGELFQEPRKLNVDMALIIQKTKEFIQKRSEYVVPVSDKAAPDIAVSRGLLYMLLRHIYWRLRKYRLLTSVLDKIRNRVILRSRQTIYQRVMRRLLQPARRVWHLLPTGLQRPLVPIVRLLLQQHPRGRSD